MRLWHNQHKLLSHFYGENLLLDSFYRIMPSTSILVPLPLFLSLSHNLSLLWSLALQRRSVYENSCKFFHANDGRPLSEHHAENFIALCGELSINKHTIQVHFGSFKLRFRSFSSGSLSIPHTHTAWKNVLLIEQEIQGTRNLLVHKLTLGCKAETSNFFLLNQQFLMNGIGSTGFCFTDVSLTRILTF